MKRLFIQSIPLCCLCFCCCSVLRDNSQSTEKLQQVPEEETEQLALTAELDQVLNKELSLLETGQEEGTLTQENQQQFSQGSDMRSLEIERLMKEELSKRQGTTQGGSRGDVAIAADNSTPIPLNTQTQSSPATTDGEPRMPSLALPGEEEFTSSNDGIATPENPLGNLQLPERGEG